MHIPEDRKLREFCGHVGSDPMLTQAAGGNVSVKVEDELWVKASGTWLADALNRDIFVPVDLSALHDQIQRRVFDYTPVALGPSRLRPSIETMMHACMPHRYVVHLHAIEPLAILVRDDPEVELQRSLAGVSFDWRLLPYSKPGGPLSRDIALALSPRDDVECLLLRNHGVVFGGETLDRVFEMICETRERLHDAARVVTSMRESEWRFEPGLVGWRSPQNQSLHALATHPELLSRLRSDWALSPDHVVFLGDKPVIVSTALSLSRLPDATQVAFVAGEGVALRAGHKAGLEEQLTAYLNVIERQQPSQSLTSLSHEQVAELLNWDAERYRVSLQGVSRIL